MIRESVRSIVGVQFRNLATIGGSIFGRFGFSDVLTCFLALDTEVELYKGGSISLEEFAKMERDNDILVRVIVKKTPGKGSYQSHRNTKTDFPVLAVAADRYGDELKVAVGARPMKAVCIHVPAEQLDACTDLKKFAKELATQVPMGSNMRGSAAYRTHLAEVLIRRALERITNGGEKNAD